MSEKQELIEREDAKPVPATAVRPPVDVIEDESGITLSADLPGVTKDRLQVRVDGDTLMVEGEASLDVPTSTERVYAEVPPLCVYRRSFTLSRELDGTSVNASLQDGVLTLRIPKTEAAKPRRIDVNVG
ncbi:MAG: Hsp20/alpha crystallin family protein [Beggiatoa sp.]|nr:Hsp20/alpha crystallin family protein [Beggiatoa sp.]